MMIGGGSIGPGWGIGKASAVVFARAGATVFIVDRNAQAAEETASVIRSEGGICAVGIGDVTSDEDVARLVDECGRHFDGVDILQNNVAVTLVGKAAELSVEDWDRSCEINLKSAFLTARSTIPVMKARGGGAIVNISSIAATRYLGVPYTAYYATKAALVQLTRATAIQYAADGIRANTILPGFIDTPHIRAFLDKALGAGDPENLVAKRGSQTPMGFMGSGWDIANAALFLCSDAARYITATELVVDGGVSAVAA